jgi:hypothetical protein
LHPSQCLLPSRCARRCLPHGSNESAQVSVRSCNAEGAGPQGGAGTSKCRDSRIPGRRSRQIFLNRQCSRERRPRWGRVKEEMTVRDGGGRDCKWGGERRRT